MGNVISPNNIETVLASARQDGQRIVSTNGCFDLLHVGHLRYLQEARKQGDLLIVAINSDASVHGLKGPDTSTKRTGPPRPILPESERAELLAGLACVDYVVIFDAPTPIDVLQQIKPNIHVKGGDYTEDSLPETPTLKSLGAEIRFIPLIQGYSTTALVNRIAGN
ncbi:MAG: adenylyltransferase/cytidyltransferase family protein [Vampirovibrio sp.]|nr:adenylyltransferase/cytidyltransferase family protein [Vampirovibrio sp.]